MSGKVIRPCTKQIPPKFSKVAAALSGINSVDVEKRYERHEARLKKLLWEIYHNTEVVEFRTVARLRAYFNKGMEEDKRGKNHRDLTGVIMYGRRKGE